MTNLITGLESITETVHECLEAENATDGLLEDVEQIITVYNNEEGVEAPAVWVIQHPTVPVGVTDLRQQLTLESPFEFVCIVYDNEPEVAEKMSQNLATRVGLSVLKNYHSVQEVRTIRKVEFNTYRPVGEISVEGKLEKVPVTGLILNVVHDINWMNCCRNIINE